jgi:glycolate oxidase FAD binding subunit
MAGSWGQLVALTQVTVKVLPKPRETKTVALQGLDDDGAVRAMCLAMRSQAEVAATAHVGDGLGRDGYAGRARDNDGGAGVAARTAEQSGADRVARRAANNTGRGPLTCFRLEGFGPSVIARAAMLRSVLAEFGAADVLSDADATSFWTRVRDATPLDDGRPLWRLNVPASSAALVTSSLREHDARWYYDWAGGLIWLTMPVNSDAALVRNAAAHVGGHAALVRADAAMRAAVPALHPEPPAVTALARRIKAGFDPANVLDPHRFSTSRNAN